MSDGGDDAHWEILEEVSTTPFVVNDQPRTGHPLAPVSSNADNVLSNVSSDTAKQSPVSSEQSSESSSTVKNLISDSNHEDNRVSSGAPSPLVTSSSSGLRNSETTASPDVPFVVPAPRELTPMLGSLSATAANACPTAHFATSPTLPTILSSTSAPVLPVPAIPTANASTFLAPTSATMSSVTTQPKRKKGPQQLGPLPESLDYICFTRDIIAERIRKDIYPIPFPIFCALWPSPNIVLIGGGGGRPGTGIGSGVVICKLHKDDVGDSHDEKKISHGNEYQMEPCAELDSQNYLVYQMCLHPSCKEFVGAVGGRVYRFIITNDTLISSRTYVQTDFHSETSEQFTSCVRFNKQGDVLVTGGEDKFIRLWTYPGFESMGTLGSHSSALSSLDVNCDGSKVISTASSKQQPCMRVWATIKATPKASSGEEALVREIRHRIKGVEVEFRCCRWAVEYQLEGREHTARKNKECILAIMNASPRGPGYLGKFDAENYSLLKLIKIDKNPLGNLETNSERDFVALANNEGGLWVYDVTTMACVNKRIKCHDLPCTSLTWSPDSSMVCSASADKSVVFVPKLGSADHNRVVLAMIVAVFFLFICLIGGLMQ